MRPQLVDRADEPAIGAGFPLRSVPDVSVPVYGASFYARVGKRAFDIVGSIVLLVLLSPVLATVSVLILLRMGRPVFHNQRRVGQHGTIFTMFKFRTMHPCRRVDDGPHWGPDRRTRHKSPDDPRHTRLGRMMRGASLDELPQLVNVLRGEMSLVGPRPEMLELYESYGAIDRPHERVRPGMTGPWQVFSRNPLDLERRIELDAGYVDRITFGRDLGLLLLTVSAVLRRTGR